MDFVTARGDDEACATYPIVGLVALLSRLRLDTRHENTVRCPCLCFSPGDFLWIASPTSATPRQIFQSMSPLLTLQRSSQLREADN